VKWLPPLHPRTSSQRLWGPQLRAGCSGDIHFVSGTDIVSRCRSSRTTRGMALFSKAKESRRMWGRRSPFQRFAMVAMHNYREQWTSRKGCEPYLTAKAETAGYDRAALLGGQGRARNLVQPLSRSAVPSSPIATLASVRSRVRTNAANGPVGGLGLDHRPDHRFHCVPAQVAGARRFACSRQ